VNERPSDSFARLTARGLLVVVLLSLVPVLAVALWAPWSLARDAGFMTIAVYASLGFGAHLFARLRGVDVARVYGPPPRTGDLVRAVVFGIATIGLNVGLLALVSGLVALLAPPSFETMLSKDGALIHREILGMRPGSRVLLGLGIAVFAPWIEEFVFRGLLFPRWTHRFGLRAGVFASAAVFGALHFTTSPFTAFLIGLALAVLYARTGSLWVPIAAHATNNGLIFLATVLLGPVAEGAGTADLAGSLRQDAPALVVGGLVLVALLLPFYVRQLRRWWPPAGAPLPYDRTA